MFVKRVLALTLLAGLGTGANAAVLLSGDNALGVNDDGSLNVPEAGTGITVANSSRLGLARDTDAPGVVPAGYYDATSPGCFCEGWGASFGAGVSMYANVSTDGGANNITVDNFASDATSITSEVSATSESGFKVSQVYTVAVADRLFVNTVTITNDTGAAIDDVRYVRVMDWDILTTEFSENVTIQGTGTTTDLERSHDNGFATANPLGFDSPLDATTLDTDFVDGCDGALPGAFPCDDHGAYFKFNFGSLADGESLEFSIYYGAADNEADMLAALALVGTELFSLGQSDDTDPAGGTPITYAFGFAGVGGTPILTPEPGTLALLGGASLLLAGMRRRQRR